MSPAAQHGRPKKERSARYRPTVWAAIHYGFWTVLIFALWPVAALLTAVKKIRHYE